MLLPGSPEADPPRRLARGLKPSTTCLFQDGGLHCEKCGPHSNELFDLFTLNAYTVEFHRRHFGADPSPLLTAPGKPERIRFNIRENPLVYRLKLASLGFGEVRQEFAHPHAMPPLLSLGDPDAINRKHYPDTLNQPEGERWKLLFTCSMFGSRAVRQP